MKKIILLLCCCYSHLAIAGWYECYNFEGSIGKQPVSISVQYRPGYFGAPAKQDLNLIGCYRYHRINTPIRLEGTYHKEAGKIALRELDTEGNPVAYLSLEQDAAKVWHGQWYRNASAPHIPVSLHLSAELLDTEAASTFEDVDIMQSLRVPDYYFVGVYTRKQDAGGAAMTRLKIIRKKDNTVYQILDFADMPYHMGNVQTIIYDNLAAYEEGNTTSGLMLWCDVGRTGGYYELHFDPQQKRFVLAAEPFIEGGDAAR